MNFKVIVYHCGCKYVLITDPAKRIEKHSRCPEHWTTQKSVLLWCVECGLRIETSPKAGHRQERCYKHAKERRNEINRKAWREGKYKYNQTPTKRPRQESQESQQRRLINDILESNRAGWRSVSIEKSCSCCS